MLEQRTSPWHMMLVACSLLVFGTSLATHVEVEPQSGWEKLDIKVVEADLRKLWSSFSAALRAGDIDKAAAFFVPARREEMAQVFHLLGPAMTELPDSWSEPTLIEVSNPFAEYAMEDESTGMLHSVQFVRFPDGKWLIQSM